jgi:hypothetical protein
MLRVTLLGLVIAWCVSLTRLLAAYRMPATVPARLPRRRPAVPERRSAA